MAPRRKSINSPTPPARTSGAPTNTPCGPPVAEATIAQLLEKMEALTVRVEALSAAPSPQGNLPSPPLFGNTPYNPPCPEPHPRDPLAEARTKCRQIIQEARKEARQELQTNDFPKFTGGTEDLEVQAAGAALISALGTGHLIKMKRSKPSSTIRAHLSSFDRLLTTSAISPGSVCSYFLLLYSLSEEVKNRISSATDFSLSEFTNVPALFQRFELLYNDLRSALLKTYQDVSEAARLRQEWHELQHKDGSSYLAFLSDIDKFQVELRLQGDVLTDAAVYDKLVNCSSAPYNDWALQYLLESTPLSTARSQLESRAKLRSLSLKTPATVSTPPTSSNTTTTSDAVSYQNLSTIQDSRPKYPRMKDLPPSVCKRCFAAGHKAQACMETLPKWIEARCLACGHFGHSVSDCRMAKDRKLRCDRCGLSGHLCFACRKPPKTLPTSPAQNSGDPQPNQDKAPPAPVDSISGCEPLLDATPNASWVASIQCEQLNEILADDYHSSPLRASVELVSVSESSCIESSSRVVVAMLDTGAGRNFINQRLRSSLPASYIKSTASVSAKAILADGSTFRCCEAVLLTVRVPHKTVEVWCLVAPASLTVDLILGMSALRALSLLLHLSSEGVVLHAAVERQAALEVSSPDRSVSSETPQNLDFLHILADIVNVPEALNSPISDSINMDSFLSGLESPTLSNDVSDAVSEEPLPTGYNETCFRGFVLEPTTSPTGKKGVVKRFQYGVPWLSSRRLPKPTAEDICSFISRHQASSNKLKQEGTFDDYAKVFQRYIDMGVLVKVDKSEWPRVTGLISHFAVLSPSKSTPVRPVLNGVIFRGLIGSGLGRTKPSDAILRGTLPHLFAFRSQPSVAIVDLECAYYQLRNSTDPDVAFLFCLAWRDNLFRLISPPMGSPHSAAALQHAVSYMCKEAQTTFDAKYKSKATVVYSGYMDDLIICCSEPSLLAEAVDILLSTCRKYGFHCQPKKCRIGIPSELSCKVLGMLWTPDDTLSDNDGPDLLPMCVLAFSKDKVIYTRRDVMSAIAQCYDPLGFRSNLLLRMRYILRQELERDSCTDLDAFVSIDTYKALQTTLAEFKLAPAVDRVLKLGPGAVLLLFADASCYGTAAVICDSEFNVVRCSAHLIQAVKQSWSIVRKELLSCLEAALLFAESMRAIQSVTSCAPTPELYTDNEANYYRLSRAFSFAEDSPDYEAFSARWKSMALPSWERKTLFKIATLLVPYGGRVYHLSGKRNPSDAYSRGLPVTLLPSDDPSLKEAVRQARLRADRKLKLSNDESYSLISVICDDGYGTIGSLKDYVKVKQEEDPDFRRLLNPSPNSKPDARIVRKYSVVSDSAGAYVINSVTRGLAVPRELRREVCDKLHLFFVHLGAYKIYKSVQSEFDAGPLSEYLRAQQRCPICIGQRNTRTVRHTLGSRITRASQPWELLGIDLLGPYKQEGFRDAFHDSLMCLLVVDAVTGFIAYALVPNNAPTSLTIAALESIFLTHGYPLGMLSDADARFTSTEATTWSKALGIRWSRSPGHSSRLNGWHESRHRLVNFMLRCLLQQHENKVSWSSLMPRVCFIVNNIVRSSLSSSTFSSDLHYVHGRCLPPSVSPNRTLSKEATESLDCHIPLRMPDRADAERMLYDVACRISADCKWTQVSAENDDATLRSRSTFADVSIARSDFSSISVGSKVLRYNFGRNKLGCKWLTDTVYIVRAIKGQVAVISPVNSPSLLYEYIGNLKIIPSAAGEC
ncbi:hypothetical protein FOL47_002858 [Perkinsus chesapeaki]|uniref:Integrase catalytic domain-containing protein n=1 Tax=Perkinsus chesapeaki TaxID=330153 RepID=A0A7J6MCA4_PERCH|nr:hypothetical protein FOL47_002858 [Perkinsus chesapeaki]